MNERNWYFTFGSDENYPYQNGYLIVKAETLQQAIALFKVKYPNREGSGCINCSFYYSQEQWDRERIGAFYTENEFFEVLSLEVYSFVKETITCDVETELTREEVVAYMKAQGTGIDETQPDGVDEGEVIWWLKYPVRREQLREAVRNNYCLLDFDEWQAIQNVLFRHDDIDRTMPFKTALKINCALWEDLDETPLELEGDMDLKVQWVTIYKDLVTEHDDNENLARMVVPTEWLLKYLRGEGKEFADWNKSYTADETMDMYEKAKEDGVIMVIDF